MRCILRNIKPIVFFLLTCTIQITRATPPQLTLVLFIDQLNQQTVNAIKPYLSGGLNYLINNGTVYHNAHWPFAMPATATSHAGLTTGTYAANNGISDNSWIDENGKKIRCDDDTAEQAAVFAPTGLYNYGKSARKIMVDTITDQFRLQSNNLIKKGAFSISLKSRSAIMLSGSLGKAVWYDERGNQFTSSKAYFAELPSWLKQFNIKRPLDKPIIWNTAYPQDHNAYQSAYKNYRFARMPSVLEKQVKPEYRIYTPHAQQVLFDLAQTCIDQELGNYDELLLGISFSSSDKVGHVFGPNSIEYLDMLYHFDKQLEQFLQYVYQKVSPEKVLIVFTADHGSMPIPELLQERGFTNARRISTHTLKEQINRYILQKFNIASAVRKINAPDIYLNHQQISAFSTKQRTKITKAIKQFVKTVPGIKNVWIYNELENSCFEPDEFEYFYKKQLFPHRSGDLIFSVFPYTYVSKHSLGTSHKSPYNYDTHIPLIIHQKGSIGSATILDKVWGCQVATTLSRLLKIPRPSSATFEALPGINYVQ